MHIRTQPVDASIDPKDQYTIPMIAHRFGSWQIAISRKPRAKDDLARHYDAASRNWQHITRRYGLAAAYRKSLVASGVGTALGQIGSRAEVLDCGIGTGALAIALSSILTDPPRVHGIDVSPEMLALCAVEMRRAGLTPDLRRADVLSIPFADASFDLVMAAHVIEHLPEPQHALREMVRVLKPGGMLFVCMVRRSGFGALVQMRWRTWAISEPQGIAWLQACHLENIGSQPVHLGYFAGQASTAFWARRAGEPEQATEIDPAITNRELVS
ncbi:MULTISPECIES: class I SAM-dependent methyltransferase [unclassified Leisingera]|uniref:class I SAM-dependent methyltransferase n=1 Tax=unclassified Leisingera TaxID=2614906 RepID=UPI001012ACD9|nr:MULTISPECIES: class I SAM-dependent methyltransferase [unclassified Leisingera]MCF6433452.1 class I SAM-dependent methyltransferase [Leisingera sp. MMG026]QAX31036.1 class I SAM-dependent methyltransferase [Leisingera sp. NJS204]